MGEEMVTEYNDSIDVAAHCARAAMGLMDRHGVPAQPHNFTVWYAFVADRHPELSQAVQGILRTGQPFSEVTCAELYERFFGSASQEEKLRLAGQRIEDAVSRVLDYLSHADQGAAQYGEILQAFSGHLSPEANPERLAELVSNMLEETRAMVEVNRQLKERLESSSHEVARLREDLNQLKREATTDPLTGLANRKLFDISLREAALLADDGANYLSLLMIDIDFFKHFNDSHGHMLGDQVLKLVAKTISDSVKGRDTAARYGGEEFAVILPKTKLKDAVVVAENIRSQVAGKNVLNRRTGQILGQVTLSAGVAEYAFGEALGAFIHRADEALYLAKRSGRNRVASQEDLLLNGHLGFGEE